jgi:apolipoprotein N-acyltransferase
MNRKQIQYPIKDRWSYLWLGIGTLLNFFWVVPLVNWLTPIFMLRFMRTQKTWRGFLLIWLSSLVTLGITQREFLPLPLPVYIVTMVFTSLTAASLPYLADRLLVPRLGGLLATLVYPLAATSMDYIGAMTNPQGSIGGQAYGQIGDLMFMQLASITGMWGIVFLVNWFGVLVNWAWEWSFEWKEIRRGVLIYAGVLLLVFAYGGVRLAFARQPSHTVRMHGITEIDMRQELDRIHQVQQESWEEYRQLVSELREPYLEATLREAQNGAQLVHWPEMAVWVPEEDEAEFYQRASEIARQEDVYLAMGLVTVYNDDRRSVNKIVIMDPMGENVLEHHKYGGAAQEGFQPGDGVYKTVETPFGTLSGIVCNDTDHQEMVSQAGRNGTDILLSPTLEYRGIDPIHAHMATFRAIENGITIVRQADNGLSVVIDPYGRTVASMDHFTTSERVLVAQVPVGSVKTLYAYTPDLFAWLAMLGFVTIAIVAIIQGRRAKQAAAAQKEAQPEHQPAS